VGSTPTYRVNDKKEVFIQHILAQQQERSKWVQKSDKKAYKRLLKITKGKADDKKKRIFVGQLAWPCDRKAEVRRKEEEKTPEGSETLGVLS